MTTAISVHGLRKSFGSNEVLKGVDMEVAPGTVYALLGPNGAGKTTIVNILSTLVPAGAGTVEVAGHDVQKQPAGVRKAIGVTGQFSAVDGLLTGTENLQLMADLHHLPKVQGRKLARELLDRFDLTEAAGRAASTYSGGMTRRLDLAMTLIGNPSVIFLDEPTTGLDPRSRRTMWEIIRGLLADGVTIFLTTQYLEEADQLAGRTGHIAVLDGGRIVAEGTAEELKRRIPGGHISVVFADQASLHRAAQVVPGQVDDETLTLSVDDGSPDSLRHLLDTLHRESVTAEQVSVRTPDLDDVFFAFTGQTREVVS